MATATLTSKGQLTVPKAVREALHLRPGDRLEFTVEDDGTVRVHALTRRVAEVFAMLSDHAAGARTVAEIDDGLERAFQAGML